jgi:hypothetical protein
LLTGIFVRGYRATVDSASAWATDDTVLEPMELRRLRVRVAPSPPPPPPPPPPSSSPSSSSSNYCAVIEPSNLPGVAVVATLDHVSDGAAWITIQLTVSAGRSRYSEGHTDQRKSGVASAAWI